MPAKILVADDNPDTCASLKLILEHHGYEVRIAADGEQAIALQKAESAHVLITDLFMPGKDGFETLAQFKAAYPATKVIVISGDSRRIQTDHLPTAEVAGADATLRKPFDPQALLELLGRLA